MRAWTVGADDIRVAQGLDEALLLIADAFFWSQRQELAALALRHRFPAMFPETEFAAAGGLMGHGPNVSDAWTHPV